MDGVDSAMSRVQDTREVVVMEGPPPENVSVRVTAVSQCGQRSNPASATTSVATVSAGKELGRNPLSYISSNLCASKKKMIRASNLQYTKVQIFKISVHFSTLV